VLFVSHRRPEVMIVARTEAGWEERVHRAGETVKLQDPVLSLGVDEPYAGIQLVDA
jgi:hypothetical protein